MGLNGDSFNRRAVAVPLKVSQRYGMQSFAFHWSNARSVRVPSLLLFATFSPNQKVRECRERGDDVISTAVTIGAIGSGTDNLPLRGGVVG